LLKDGTAGADVEADFAAAREGADFVRADAADAILNL